MPLNIDTYLMQLASSLEDQARLESIAQALTRLIDIEPEMVDYWRWAGKEPLRCHFACMNRTEDWCRCRKV